MNEELPDIAKISETKFADVITDVIFPEGYQTMRKNKGNNED